MKLDSKILSYLFDYFNNSNVEYCVMNNYENMPEIIPTDVDIAIDNDTLKKLDTILANISARYNVEIIQKIWHGYRKFAYILSPLKIDSPFRLQLDFFVDFSGKGYPNLISNNILLKNRKSFKNFYVPDPTVELLFLFIRRIIKNDMVNRHTDKMIILINEIGYERARGIFSEIFGDEISNTILELIKSNNISEFQKNLNKYRKALKKWSKKNTSIGYRINYLLTQVRRFSIRLRYPVGFSIALLGPDGSGKSTIAKHILERVSGSFHGEKIQYWRPYLLPAMGRLKFWNPSEDIATNPRPHDHPKQNRIKSFIRFFYYLADYLIGYPIKIYWAKVKKKIIIFDRYYYDYLVDLHRYNFNLPKWIPKFFLPLISAPDLTIYLDADPEVLHNRKKELPLHELKRQCEEFKKALAQIPNSMSVLADKPINEIVSEVSYQILKKKSLQTKKILNGWKHCTYNM